MKCINCSYKNIARSISFLDKIVIFVCAGKYPYMLELLQFVNPESSLSWLVYSYVVTVCKILSRGLHGSSSLRKKTCLWRFHKGHNQGRFKGQRRSSMPTFEIQLVETKPSISMTSIFTCVLLGKLVSKVMYILNIRYYITEKDLSSCRHINRRGS